MEVGLSSHVDDSTPDVAETEALKTTPIDNAGTRSVVEGEEEPIKVGQAHPARQVKFDYSQAIHVIVGGEGNEMTFTISELMLCERSGFFHAATRKESKTRTVSLPTLNPIIFQVYLHFIYKREIELETLGNTPSPHNDMHDNHSNLQYQLVALYCLADYLQDDTCADRTLAELLNSCEAPSGPCLLAICPNACFASCVYKATGPGSSLRALVVDVCRFRAERVSFRELLPWYPEEFKTDLLLAALDEIQLSDWSEVRERMVTGAEARGVQRELGKEQACDRDLLGLLQGSEDAVHAAAFEWE